MNTSFQATTRSTKNFEQQWVDYNKRPSEAGLSTIMQEVEPTISSALMSFTGGDKSLLPRARIIAAQAITSYDPKQGTTLKTHVYNNLKGLNRFKAERSAVVHIPENVRLDTNALYKYRQSFTEENGRDPTVDEINDQLGLGTRRLKKAETFGKELSSSQMVSDKGDINIFLKDNDDPWFDYVYHDLDNVQKKIMEWTTGYGGSEILPKKEIAKRLGISAPAISQRIGTIVKRLEKPA
jgi:DNA-directed RNA polymerase specialized sigma subunit